MVDLLQWIYGHIFLSFFSCVSISHLIWAIILHNYERVQCSMSLCSTLCVRFYVTQWSPTLSPYLTLTVANISNQKYCVRIKQLWLIEADMENKSMSSSRLYFKCSVLLRFFYAIHAFNKSVRHLEFLIYDVIRKTKTSKTSAAIFEFWLAWEYHVRTRGKVRPLWIALFHSFPL